MAEGKNHMFEEPKKEKTKKESQTLQERRIILIGNLGAGKSHCGNGILGGAFFKSKRCWSLVTEKCEYTSAERNGLMYVILDTPGINLADERKKDFDIMNDIKRHLLCASPGFHAIVLVLSADERLTTDFLRLIDGLLGENAYEYMIIILSKIENENELKEIKDESDQLMDLISRCKNRVVIFGNNPGKIPSECLKIFDDTLTNLIAENIHLKKEYYTHEESKRAKDIIKKDTADYLKTHPNTGKDEAFDIATTNAAMGLSPRDKKIVGNSCSIS